MKSPEIQKDQATHTLDTPGQLKSGPSFNPPAFQLKAGPIQKKDPTEGEETTATTEKFLVSDAKAYMRNEKFEKLGEDKIIPKWTEVIVTERKTSGKTEYAHVTSPDGATDYNWTSSSNLYSLSWKASDHEKKYKGVSSSYWDMMSANDPETTRADLMLSGAGVKDTIDKYYPNSTDPAKLDTGFKSKLDKMTAGFKANGINATANAGLRHPMRSVVFNYCILVGNAKSADIIHEANAVCTKYGIPIDWAHRKDDGTIDLATSKAKAKEIKSAFGIKGAAARGVTDFGGTISNHNNGKAVDLTLSFTFTKAKDIVVGDKTYSIDPSAEVGDYISNVKDTPLSKYGKDQFGLTRAIDNDTVHWSASGR